MKRNPPQTDQQKPKRVSQLTKKLNELVADEISKNEGTFADAK